MRDTLHVQYESREPQPPLDGLLDDFYFLEGESPYPRLSLPPMPGAFLIVNLGEPFRIRGGADAQASEFADGCVVSVPTRALEFGYPPWTRSVGIHFKPWGLAPFLPMPVADLCDRPATLEQVWGRPAVDELRARLSAADGSDEMLAVLEDELLRHFRDIPGLEVVRVASNVIVETRGTVAISSLSEDAGVSATHLTRRFKEIIGVPPKRLARSQRFAATLLAIDFAAPVDWGAIAAEAGYSDQAHFGHEFRAFTGLTPSRYAEVRRQFTREHPDNVLDSWPLPAD
jgi:AraC-like DNA-binding protein